MTSYSVSFKDSSASSLADAPAFFIAHSPAPPWGSARAHSFVARITRMMVIALALITLMAGHAAAQAQGTGTAQGGADVAPSKLFIEMQPLAFVFRGASLGILYQRGHWRVGGGGYFFTLPDLLVDQSDDNANQGWNVHIRPAVWIEGNYALRTDGRGLFFGINLVLQRLVLQNRDAAGEASYQSLMLLPKVGYTFLLGEHLAITPYAGVELHNQVEGETRLGEREFVPTAVQPLMNVSLSLVF